MLDAALPTALVAYIVGIVLAIVGTVYGSRAARRAASVVFVLTWIAHLGAILGLVARLGRVPLSNLPEFLLMLGWAVLTLHLLVWFRLQVHGAGLVLPPIAAVASFVAWSLPAGVAEPVTGPSAGLLFHTTVSTLGMATLCVAFAMSLLYLVQDRALKGRKTLLLLERLPALERCDRIGYQAMLIGFSLLTLGIGTGLAISAVRGDELSVSDPKQIFSLLAWAVFAAILTFRRLLGFRGRLFAYLTITGFGLGLMTVLGMRL